MCPYLIGLLKRALMRKFLDIYWLQLSLGWKDKKEKTGSSCSCFLKPDWSNPAIYTAHLDRQRLAIAIQWRSPLPRIRRFSPSALIGRLLPLLYAVIAVLPQVSPIVRVQTIFSARHFSLIPLRYRKCHDEVLSLDGKGFNYIQIVFTRPLPSQSLLQFCGCITPHIVEWLILERKDSHLPELHWLSGLW